MAVDKLFFERMDKDKSPLLFEKGDYIDAFNASLADYGGSTEGTLKPVKGNNYATYIAGANPNGNRTIIGSVADVSRDRVYFFVKTNNPANSGIYMYNNSTNTVLSVLVSSVLNFQNVSFVKADVVNADFRQDGTVTPMLYFTDGVNEPRRINVDRAIAGEYSTYGSTDLNFELSVCKAAPVTVPHFFFDTDTNILSNNLHGNAFQFAIQYLYRDGEESAISGYSRIAYTNYTAIETLENSGSEFYRDNVCKIDIARKNYSSIPATQSAISDIASVSKVRLLGRNGNDGAFFVIDEFDPNKALVRHIFNTSINVYDPVLRQYKFYNEGLYSPVSQDDVNKLYDNVPFTAIGQCVAGNRLMYSNYTEGRENIDVSKAQILVSYSSSQSTGNINVPNTTSSVTTKINGQNQIRVDLLATNGFGSSSVIIPSGSITTLSFKFNPKCTVTNYEWQTDPFHYYETTLGLVNYKVIMPQTTQVFSKRSSDLDQYVNISIYADSDLTVSQLRERIQDELSSTKIIINSEVLASVPYHFYRTDTQAVEFLANLTEDNDYYEVEWSFDDFINISGTAFTSKPYISNVVSKKTGSSQNTRKFFYTSSGVEFEAIITGQGFKELTKQANVFYQVPSNETTLVDVNPNTFSSVGLETSQSFKAGCTHEIGVVYYDKYNRSGNVNVIGSFYSFPFGHPGRSGKNGSTSVSVNFGSGPSATTVQPPSWASRYQIVYAGPSTYDSFVSYTTGGAYPKLLNNEVDANNKKIYVSLKTLEKYASEKSSIRNYSFTPGDKLRVISYDSGTTTLATEYPVAQERQVSGSYTNSNYPMEFNVVGFEVLSSTNNPIAPSGQSNNEKYHGDFVVLEAPETMTSPPKKKYIGWDWYHITGLAYEGGDTTTETSRWGKKSVVEILTPKKSTSEKIYYEIGNSCEFTYRDPYVLHGSNSTNQGDVHIRTTPCKTAFYDATNGWQTVGSPDLWKYVNVPLESNSISDIKNMPDWSRGRAHVKYDKSRTKSERNGIIYSDAYEQDVLKNSLSSFNPSLANFSYADRAYGALNYIGSLGENLVAIQENKTSMAGVNRNIVSYSDGQESVAVSGDVIGPFRYLSGDFGCGNLHAGVLKLNNQFFYTDPDKRKVIRFSADQAYVISDNGMMSYFDPKTISSCKSGYDPQEDIYYLTINDQETVGYSLAKSNWISRYSFVPDRYETIGSNMITFKVTGVPYYMAWKHNGETDTSRCVFYGQNVASGNNYANNNNYFSIKTASAAAPSNVKVFNSISIEGKNRLRPAETIEGSATNNSTYYLTQTLTTDLNHSVEVLSAPVYREGTWFYNLSKSRRSGNIDALSPVISIENQLESTYNTTSNIVWLGRRNQTLTPTSVVTNGVYYTTVFFDNRVSDLPLRIGDRLYAATQNGNELIQLPANQLNSINADGSLTFSASETIQTNNGGIYCLIDQQGYGIKGEDPRGHYAVIELYGKGPQASASEMYCINVNVSDSKDHHVQSQE
jgi:hypothetical protein